MISKDVDGGPPPAMTITTNRRVNDFGAWYYGVSFTFMAGLVVQFGDMADTCSETWLTPQVVVKSIAPIRCAPKKMP